MIIWYFSWCKSYKIFPIFFLNMHDPYCHSSSSSLELIARCFFKTWTTTRYFELNSIFVPIYGQKSKPAWNTVLQFEFRKAFLCNRAWRVSLMVSHNWRKISGNFCTIPYDLSIKENHFSISAESWTSSECFKNLQNLRWIWSFVKIVHEIIFAII